MLTLNEIRNVNFRKSNFGGYRAEDVEAFIDEVQLSYDSLLKENAELLKRLESLTAKLEEYQQEEDSIRNALMNAQKVGDASLRDAKHKAEIILKDATIKAEKIVSNAQIEIHRERDVIEKMQRDIADFKAKLLKTYKEHLTLINSIPNEDIMRQDTKDAVSAVPMLDRDTAYASSRRDYGRDDYAYGGGRDLYGAGDNMGGNPFGNDAPAAFAPQGTEVGYADDRRSEDRRDERRDFGNDMGRFNAPSPMDAPENAPAAFTNDPGAPAFGKDEQPVLPRERISQSRGGFTVNIDDNLPAPQTTTLPPPARGEQKFSAFDSGTRRGFDDGRQSMGGFDRSPINSDDLNSFGSGGGFSDPSSLIGGGGEDFSRPAYDTGSGGGMPDDRDGFRRRFS